MNMGNVINCVQMKLELKKKHTLQNSTYMNLDNTIT